MSRYHDSSAATPPHHLPPEGWSEDLRTVVLARLTGMLEGGVHDPGLLYLGARISASLGSSTLVEKFAAPLLTLLRTENGALTDACLPVGLLWLSVLPAREKRDTLARELKTLANHLSHECLLAWAVMTHAPDAPTDATLCPPAWRDLAPLSHLTRFTSVIAGMDSAEATLARTATEAYGVGRLREARAALEDLLLSHGDQPDILRNLITVTSESGDLEAHERYWRRFVKLWCWHTADPARSAAAWHELRSFYTLVSRVSDREFASLAEKERADALRRPGLLARWLESHAALIWLNPRSLAEAPPGILAAFRQHWFEVFYPELSTLMQASAAWPPLPLDPSPLPRDYDPVFCLLRRFAEWSGVAFGLAGKDTEPVPPQEAAARALMGFVVRIPRGDHLAELQKLMAGGDLNPPPFAVTWRNALSIPWTKQLDQAFKNKQWDSLQHLCPDPSLASQLSPTIKLASALGLAHVGEIDDAIAVAAQTIAHLEEGDGDEDGSVANLLGGVINRSIHGAPDDEEKQKDVSGALNRLNKVLNLWQAVQPAEAGVAMHKKNLKDIKETAGFLEGQVKIEAVVKQLQPLVDGKKFDEALKLINSIPTKPENVAKVRTQLREQIEKARDNAKVHQQIEDAAKKAGEFISDGRFDDARKAIRALPDAPDDLREVKTKFLGQVDDAAKKWNDITAENTKMMLKLSNKNVNFTVLTKIAKDNDIDMANPFQMNPLLKAVLKQL